MKTPLLPAALLATSIFAAAFSPPASAEDAAPIEVFILAGQSNMVGQGDGSELPDALQKGNGRVLRWVDGAWQSLRPIKPSTDSFLKRGIKGPTFGPEISFGSEIGTALPDRRIGIVKVSVGGTGILAWSPTWTLEEANRSGDGKKGDLYKAIIDQVTAIRKKEPVELKGFFWLQGGKDMRYPDLADEYAANLVNLVTALRKDLGAPELPAFVGVPFDPSKMTDEEKNSPEMQQILDSRPGAIIVAAAWAQAEDKIPHTTSVLMPGLERWPNNVHYSTAGCLQAGRHFANAFLEPLE
jgi:hypothetical protein